MCITLIKFTCSLAHLQVINKSIFMRARSAVYLKMPLKNRQCHNVLLSRHAPAEWWSEGNGWEKKVISELVLLSFK